MWSTSSLNFVLNTRQTPVGLRLAKWTGVSLPYPHRPKGNARTLDRLEERFSGLTLSKPAYPFNNTFQRKIDHLFPRNPGSLWSR